MDENKKKSPILMYGGLAAAAAVALLATSGQWMWSPPELVATTQAPPAAEAPKATAEKQNSEPAAAPSQPPEAPAATEVAKAPVKPAEVASTEPEVPATEPPATAQAAPTFDTVRVEKSGETVVAGQAEAGSEVTLKLDGQTIGSGTANNDGSFVIVPEQPLPAGSGSLIIESKSKNQTEAVKSEQEIAVIVPQEAKQNTVVAMVSPNEPTKVLQAPAAAPPAEPVVKQAPSTTVTLDAVDYDESGNITFAGRGEPGTVARLYVDNALTGDAAIGSDGRWNFAGGKPIAAGKHALRVDAIDAKGNVATRVEVPFFREEQTKIASNEVPEPAANTTVATQSQTAVTTTTTTADAGATAATAEPTLKEGRIVIQPGNNLWRLSRVIYGKGTKFTVIWEANKDQIRNPKMIFPGQVFITPEVVPPEKIDPKRREPMKPEEMSSGAQ